MCSPRLAILATAAVRAPNVVVHRQAAGIRSVRFRVEPRRRRRRGQAPVVKDARKMMDAVGSLRHTQRHIVVLGAIALGPEPAGCLSTLRR